MKEKTVKSALTTVGVMFMIIFSLTPFIYMAVVSFGSRVEFLIPGIEYGVTWENYRAVVGESSLHFLRYLRNSLVISGLSAFFCVLIASLAAYALTRLQLPGRLNILFLILAVAMFPQIGLVGFLYRLMISLGWLNTYRALLFPYIAWTLPLSLWILTSYFNQIPVELDKAATVDGCSKWQILYKIILPVAAPGVFSIFLLAFIFAFNEFMFALMLTTDHRARTIPVGIAMFEGLHGQTPWGNIMAAAVITVLPVVLMVIVFQKKIIGGLTRGAVKG